MPKHSEKTESKHHSDSDSKHKNKSKTSKHGKKKAITNHKNVKVSDFVVSRYKIDPIKEFGKKDGNAKQFQYNAFPKYIFGEGKITEPEKQSAQGEKMIVVTDQIKLEKGGIPKCDGTYRKTENDCMYIWVPLLKDSKGGRELCEKVLLPIDKYNLKKIVDEKNKDFLVKIDESGKPKPFKDLKYVPCVREFTPGEGDDDDASAAGSDDEEDNKKSKGKGKSNANNQESYDRVKVKISTKWDPNAAKDAEKEIDTNVYLVNEKGKPKKQKVETMEDLRALVTWKSVVRLALEFSKFWVMKNVEKDGDKKTRKCGMAIKCLSIFIEEKGEASSGNTNLGAGVFGDYGSDAEDSESGNDSGSDDEKPKTKKSKSKGKKQDSDDEDGSDDEKPTKGKAKGKGKKQDSDDDGSDDDVPKKPAKGKGKKQESSDDDGSDDE